MARTVDTSSTLEDFRQSYNGLAEEIGGLSDLRTSNKTSMSLMAQTEPHQIQYSQVLITLVLH